MSDMTVNTVELEEIVPGKTADLLFRTEKLNLVADVRVELTVELGNTSLTVQELFELKKGSVLKLDSATDAELLVKLNGNIVAKGTLVAVDDNFGIQITEVMH
jgi:flagellar motor switch protein FliN/FliY